MDPAGRERDTYGDDPVGTGLDPACVLPAMIARWAAADPERPFLAEVGGRSVTYGQTYDELGRWCALLRGLGVRDGVRVASFLPASIDSQLLWLAVSCLGAYEVAVNPDLRGEMLDHVLRDSGAGLCFARPEHAAVPRSSRVDVSVIEVPRDGSLLSGLHPDPVRLPGPADVSCVIYTSGTTGPAKGAVIRWAQLSAILGRTPRAWFGPDDAVYAPLPMFHVTGRTPLLTMADVGGRVVLRERASVSEFWGDVRAHGCTSTTVSMASLLLTAPPGDADRDHPLRLGLMGALGPVAVAFQERFGVKIVGNYGSTEIGFPFTNRDVTAETCHLAGWLRPGYEAQVVDETGRALPRGEVGELCVRPAHRLLLMEGYLGHPDLTTKAVVDGWYHTGDAVVLHDDGSLQYVDRLRDTLRRMGENISSTAVESQVNIDAEVHECAVLGVPSAVTGQEVLLIVRPAPGTVIEPAALFARLQEVLPRHCLPAYVALRDDEFPKTPNGKIRKELLRAHVGELLAGAWVSPWAVASRSVRNEG